MSDLSISELGQTVITTVDERMGELSAWNRTIFEFGETAWREERSARWYVERLRAEGFTVEEGSDHRLPIERKAEA